MCVCVFELDGALCALSQPLSVCVQLALKHLRFTRVKGTIRIPIVGDVPPPAGDAVAVAVIPPEKSAASALPFAPATVSWNRIVYVHTHTRTFVHIAFPHTNTHAHTHLHTHTRCVDNRPVARASHLFVRAVCVCVQVLCESEGEKGGEGPSERSVGRCPAGAARGPHGRNRRCVRV